MKRIAIIPARGGSKRIPRKNIKPFLGKPVIAYSIEAALQSHLFDEVMVSTDDEEIASIAKSYGASVPFLRSEETASDYATTADVLTEVLRTYAERGIQFDLLCCLYATVPFVTPEKLTEGCRFMTEQRYDSAFTVVSYSHPIQRCIVVEKGKAVVKWPQYQNCRTQDLEKTYHDAGQFYFSDVDAFLERHLLTGPNTGAIILPELEVQDIDSEIDWQLAEMKYELLQKNRL